MCAGETCFLSVADEDGINKKSQPYYDKEWLLGKIRGRNLWAINDMKV